MEILTIHQNVNLSSKRKKTRFNFSFCEFRWAPCRLLLQGCRMAPQWRVHTAQRNSDSVSQTTFMFAFAYYKACLQSMSGLWNEKNTKQQMPKGMMSTPVASRRTGLGTVDDGGDSPEASHFQHWLRIDLLCIALHFLSKSFTQHIEWLACDDAPSICFECSRVAGEVRSTAH